MWYDDDNLATSLMETTVQSGAGHKQVSGQWVVMRVMGWLSGMGGYWLGL